MLHVLYCIVSAAQFVQPVNQYQNTQPNFQSIITKLIPTKLYYFLIYSRPNRDHLFTCTCSSSLLMSTSSTYIDAMIIVKSQIHPFLTDNDISLLICSSKTEFSSFVESYRVRRYIPIDPTPWGSVIVRISNITGRVIPSINSSIVENIKKRKLNIVNFDDYNPNNEDSPEDLEIISKARGLKFSGYFRSAIERDHLPVNLESLDLGNGFNQPIIENIFPSSLKSLTFGQSFNQPLANILPVNLKSLTLGDRFNQPLPSLPITLEHLILGDNFNHPLPLHLPPGLLTLEYGQEYNHPVEIKNLPSTLQSLKFCEYFDKEITHPLPVSLKELSFHSYYHQKLNNNFLPAGLVSLKIGSFNNSLIPDKLPASIKSLTIGHCKIDPFQSNKIPSSLESLTIEGSFHYTVDLSLIQQSVPSLTSLTINQTVQRGYRTTQRFRSAQLSINYNVTGYQSD